MANKPTEQDDTKALVQMKKKLPLLFHKKATALLTAWESNKILNVRLDEMLDVIGHGIVKLFS